MKIRVLYFASLREKLGRAADDLEVPAGATPRAVLDQVLGEKLAQYRAAVAFSVNHEYTPGDRPLCDGDEVAFLPPVSGG